MTIEKDGYVYEYGKFDRVVYIKTPKGLEMWFDKHERLIRVRWKDGREQIYKNRIVKSINANGKIECIFRRKFAL